MSMHKITFTLICYLTLVVFIKAQHITVHTISSSVPDAMSAYAADLDGDGDMDIIGASYSNTKLIWFENDGNQNFTSHNLSSTNANFATAVYATDMDGDGDMDVLSSSFSDKKIAWYENDGNPSPSFTIHTITTSANGAQSVYATDMDGDGDIDVLGVAFNDYTVIWYENNGSQSFTAHTIASSATDVVSAYAADVDSDGDVDVLSGSFNGIVWYENDGNQSFTPHTITSVAQSVYAIDMDDDGDMDVLGTKNWYENNGSQSFTSHTISSASLGSVYATDMDGDGDIDILGASSWYKNDGSQNFTPRTLSADGSSIYAADIDGDGDMDALNTSYVKDKIIWYEFSPIPTLSTSTMSSITSSGAFSGGDVTDNGGFPVTERGVCWSTSPDPTIADSKTSDGTGMGSFTSSLTGLSSGVTYYVRAYATNSEGTAYGNQQSFTTLAIPSLSTLEAFLINDVTATSGGNITSDGGVPITARGVCWSTSPNPTIADSKTSDGTGTGTFTSSLTGLITGTTYYVRAYATNSEGTGYGDQVCFTAEKILFSITPAIPTTLSVNSDAVTFTATPAGGTWSGAGTAVDGTFDPSVSGAGMHELTYTYINGCTTWDTSVTVHVYPGTEIKVTVSQEAICPGGSSDLIASCNHALEFAGSSYIRFDQAAPFIANSDFTFSAWLKLASTSSDREIFAINTGSGGNRILMPYRSNGTVNIYDNVSYYPSNTQIDDANWHHVAYTYNKTSKEAKIYIDGVLDNTVTLVNMSATGVASDDRLSLGQEFDGSSASDFLNGTMDEVRLWNTLLTESEINSWMHKELNDTHPQYDHLVTYYNFNVPDADWVYDYSENYYTGDIHGSPDFVVSDIASFEDPCTYSWTSVPAGFSSSDSMITAIPAEATTYQVEATATVGGTGNAFASVMVYNLVAPEISSNSPICEGEDLQLYDASGGGNALNFDGTNDWVELDALADDIAGKDFTVSFWMKQTGSSGISDLFAINQSPTSSDDNRLLLELNNSTGIIDIYNSGGYSSRKVNDGNWHHVAMSLDQSEKEATLYMDGIFQFTVTVAIPVSSDRVSLGQEWDSSPSNFFKGQMDEIRIYKTVRTQSEIVSDMFYELSSSEYSNLYAYYKLNESSGTTVTDATGNGNDGNKKDGTNITEGPTITPAGWRTHSWTGPDSFTSTESDPILASATASASGTYSLIVNIMGCTTPEAETTVSLKSPTLDPGITPAGPFCSGANKDTLESASSGGVWSGVGILDAGLGIFDPSVAGPGTHSIIYTANDCSESKDTIEIVVYESPQLSLSSTNSSCTGCADGSALVSVTGGLEPYSYNWTGGCTDADCNGLTPGTYPVCVSDNNNCQVCDTVVIGFATSLNPSASSSKISVYPNPSYGQFTINTGGLSFDGHTVRILNVIGETVYTDQFSEQLDLQQFKKGVYTLILENENITIVKQIIIR